MRGDLWQWLKWRRRTQKIGDGKSAVATPNVQEKPKEEATLAIS